LEREQLKVGYTNGVENLMAPKENAVKSFKDLNPVGKPSSGDEESIDNVVSGLRDNRDLNHWTTAWAECKGGDINSSQSCKASPATGEKFLRILSQFLPLLLAGGTHFPSDTYEAILSKVRTIEIAVGKLLVLSPDLGFEIPHGGYGSDSLRAKASEIADKRQRETIEASPDLASLVCLSPVFTQ